MFLSYHHAIIPSYHYTISGGDGVLRVQKGAAPHQALLASPSRFFAGGTVDARQVYVGAVRKVCPCLVLSCVRAFLLHEATENKKLRFLHAVEVVCFCLSTSWALLPLI